MSIFGNVRVAAEQPRPWLAALAAEFPTARHRTVRPRLLAAAILMIGSARRLCHLAVEASRNLRLVSPSELDSCGDFDSPIPAA